MRSTHEFNMRQMIKRFRWWWLPLAVIALLYLQYGLQILAANYYFYTKLAPELEDYRAFQQRFIDDALLPKNKSFEWTDTFFTRHFNIPTIDGEITPQDVVDHIIPKTDRSFWLYHQPNERDHRPKERGDWSKYRLRPCADAFCPLQSADTITIAVDNSMFPFNNVYRDCLVIPEDLLTFGFTLVVERSTCWEEATGHIILQSVEIRLPALNWISKTWRSMNGAWGRPSGSIREAKHFVFTPKHLFDLKGGYYEQFIEYRE